MAPLPPAVAALRAALRTALPPAGPGERPLALVACSGGADSLALAVTAAFVAPRQGWRCGLLTVDHRLQAGSADRAAQVVDWAAEAGLAPAEVLTVSVEGRRGGPEAAARAARYEALAAAARRLAATAVLLGHTRDDQAETALLALARGSGPRGLAGMPARRDDGGIRWLRPLLGARRRDTAAACAALGLRPWQDPHNTDPAYARVRVRQDALPALVAALGDRVVANLARSAAMVADDDRLLTGLAAETLAAARRPDGAVEVAALRAAPGPVRTRALHRWARELGVPGGALSHRHVEALDALVTRWRGQGPTSLPGGLTVTRRADLLIPTPCSSRRS